jgi:hypothetical protein
MTDIILPADKFNNSIQAMRIGVTQSVTVGLSSAATANALSKNTIIVRLVSTSDCFVKITTGTPTATPADMFLPAGVPEYIGVDGFTTLKVAAIQSTTGGTLYVTEMV